MKNFNPNIQEASFFKNLLHLLQRNEYIRLKHDIMPKPHDSKVKQNYKNNFLIWFLRMCLNNDEKIYYFGLKETEKFKKYKPKPKLILKFNNNPEKSSIKISKNNSVSFLIKIDPKSHIYNKIREKFVISRPINNEEYFKDNYYYVKVGHLTSKKIIKNIKKLCELVDNSSDFNKELEKSNLIRPQETFTNETIKNNIIKGVEPILEYANGYCVKEGMTLDGKKHKKGSFKKRRNNEGGGGKKGFGFKPESLNHEIDWSEINESLEKDVLGDY